MFMPTMSTPEMRCRYPCWNLCRMNVVVIHNISQMRVGKIRRSKLSIHFLIVACGTGNIEGSFTKSGVEKNKL
jgi:hypothetical protein